MEGALDIRPAQRGDVPLLLELIRELADYERLAEEVVGSEEQLADSLFTRRAAEAVLAELDGEAVGYAIFFTTFSTFLCRPGLWIEDIFVRPAHRARGFGRALLSHLAGIAAERGYGRMEWAALDWNDLALGFYDRLGATRMDDWRILRIEGEPLEKLGSPPRAGSSAG